MDSSKSYINREPSTLVGWSGGRKDWIFDWQVSLAFLWTLLLQYILKLIPCSELSFRGPKLGPYQLATRIREYVLTQKAKKTPSWFNFNWRQGFVITYTNQRQKKSQLNHSCDGKSTKIPKRDFIFARVKTGQVGTWSPTEISPVQSSSLRHIRTGILHEGII